MEEEVDGAQDYEYQELNEEVVNSNKRAHTEGVFDTGNWVKESFFLNLLWPVTVFKGATWFHHTYKLFGLPDIPRLGFKLSLLHGRENNHTFYVELTNAHGQVLYGSYANNEDYIRGFSDVENVADNDLDVVQCAVKVKLRVKGPFDNDADGYGVYETGEYDIYVDANKKISEAQLSRSKRLRQESEEVAAAAVRKNVNVVAGSTKAFDWTVRLTAVNILPQNAPCRLMVKFWAKTNAELAIFSKDMDLFLRFVFAECCRLEGMENLFIYDSTKLNGVVMESEKSILFVYDEPQLYFKNVKEMGRFWEYASFLLARYYRERSSELVYFQYDNHVFRRKFLINSSCWGKSPTTILLVPNINVPETLELSKTAASRIDNQSPPVNISEIVAATLPVALDTISIESIVLAVTTTPDPVTGQKGFRGLERITANDFSKQSVRNRIMFENMQPSCCLYHLDSYSSRYVHESFITVDLNNVLHYNCSCNITYNENDEVLYRYGPPIFVGKLEVVKTPEPLYIGSPIRSVGDYGYEEDHILEYGLAGMARFLSHVFNRRLKFVADKDWYYWTGEIWELDVNSKFMTRYLTQAVPEWLKDCQSRATDDKPKLKKITKMLGQFCESTHSVRVVLELLRLELNDPNFEEKSRHRGYFAASNCIVDLRSGTARPYQYDDTVTQRCHYAYDACDCVAGHCFNHVECNCDPFDDKCTHNCNARCKDDMKWIDDRIREICGTDLMANVWYADDMIHKVPGPRDSQFQNSVCFWRDYSNNREYAVKPVCKACGIENDQARLEKRAPKKVCQCPVTRAVHRRFEHVFEDKGMRNYKRFIWTVGYILTGYADRKLFVYGYGDQNNGKTLIWNNLIDVLGLYLGPMHASCIFGKTRNDDGATPAMIHAVGKRGGVVSETGRDDVLNDHSVKVWAGRDPVVIRKMRSEMMDVKPDLVAMANANVEPKINILDEALWDRFHLLLYPMTYVRTNKRGDYPGPDWALHERPRNESYVAEFELHRNKHALANWAIRACLEYMQTPECPKPERVEVMLSEFKNVNNPIPTFIGSGMSTYRFDIREQVPLKKFFTDLKEYCRTQGIKFKFDQLASFRNLIIKLGATDSIYRLSMVGMKDSEQEMIVGIAQVNTTI